MCVHTARTARIRAAWDLEVDQPGHNHPGSQSCRLGCPGFVMPGNVRQEPKFGPFADFEVDQPGHNHPGSQSCRLGCPGWMFR